MYKSVSQDFCHVIIAAKSRGHNNHGQAHYHLEPEQHNNTITQTNGHILAIRVFLLRKDIRGIRFRIASRDVPQDLLALS